jgi:acyl carrier protein
MRKPNMDDITPDTLFEAVKSLSSAGRAELLVFLRATAIQLPPEDGETMARIADILELLLG